MMTSYGWHTFGATVTGSYHTDRGKSSDDYYGCLGTKTFTAACVSDGLGSKSHSSFGSRAACRSVCCSVAVSHGFSSSGILADVHSRWLSMVGKSGYSVRDCAATCLFAYRKGGIIRAARLGDGFIGVCMMNGDVKILTDTKEDLYVNETECLEESHCPAKWEVACFRESNVMGVVMCTDGIEVMQEDFTRDFCREYVRVDAYRAELEVNSFIGTLGFSDDKTIACILRRTQCYGQ